MALKFRPSKNDSEEVQLLFELHKTLNNNGAHWIKGFFRKKQNGEICRCLVGGVNEVTKGTGKRKGVLILLNMGLPRPYKYNLEFGKSRDLEGACISYNDVFYTTWKDIESVIRNAIKLGRSHKS